MIRRLPLLGILWLFVLASLSFAQEPTPIGPGVTYRNVYRAEGPWAIHIIEADLSQQYLELHSLLGGGELLARKSLTGIAGQENSDTARVVAAVNADFFSLSSNSGLMLGLHVQDGELVTFPDQSRSVCYRLADGTLHLDRLRANAWLRGPEEMLLRLTGMNHRPQYADIMLFTPRFGPTAKSEGEATFYSLTGLSGRLKPNTNVTAKIAGIATGKSAPIPEDGSVIAARGVMAFAMRKLKVGDEVTLSLNLEPETGPLEQAVSGGPRLVRDGAISVEYEQERFAESFAARRHPRTGLGIRNGTVVLAVVDGRQPGYSDGMTLKEFAQLFLDLGCSDALNLDGGGSSTMVVRDRVVNSPSGGAPRAIVNALAVVSVAPVGPPVQLAIEPGEFRVLSGERLTLRPTGLDQYYNPVTVDAEKVRWEASPALGTVSTNGTFTGAQVEVPTVGLVMAKLDAMTASTVARVLPAPAKLVLTPARVTLNPGSAQQFSVQAYDEQHQALTLSPRRVTWRVEPVSSGAKVDQTGRFQAPTKAGHIAVLACVGDACGQADVVVGEEFAVLESFEQEKAWTFHAEPATVPGNVAWTEDRLRDGNHGLRLNYDFSHSTGTRAVYADLNLPLPDTTAFSLYVLGDGQDGWLRARLKDGAGRNFTVDLTNKVNWKGSWRRLLAALPPEAEPPVTLEAVYLVEIHDDHKSVGAIWLDDLAAAPSLPAATAPATSPGKDET